MNLEANYLFELGEKVRVYPLAGVVLGIWHADGIDVSVGGYDFSFESQTDSKFGANLGGGIDYLLGEHWGLNAEVKYQYIKKASQVLFLVGVGYRF